MLELKNLRLTAEDGQGKVDILKDVSLSVADGEFLVITGPNGGGKTSLAKTVMGLMQPSSGQIFWNGEDVTDLSITERARRGISYGFQQPPRFKGLKVRDLLAIAAGKALGHDEACSYLTKVGLCARDYLDRDVDTSLSGGEVTNNTTGERTDVTVTERSASSTVFTGSFELPNAESVTVINNVCPEPMQRYNSWTAPTTTTTTT